MHQDFLPRPVLLRFDAASAREALQRVYRSTDLGRSWRPANRGLPGTDPRTGASTTPITCLAALEDSRTLASYLFAGGPRGLFVSGDLGETWARSGGRPTEEPIAANSVAS